MDVLEKLNQACHEEGVCEPGIKHARLMHQDTGRAVLTCVYGDGIVTSCAGKMEDGKFKSECCYSTEPGQQEVFWAWVAHLSAVGYKEQAIEVD